MHTPTLRKVSVVRALDLTPGMRRITLGGPQLGAFVSMQGYRLPAFRSDGFDDEIRIVLPEDGAAHALLPIQCEGTIRPPDQGRVLSRPYTVRRWSPDSGELDVDVVTHGVGVGAQWASGAAAGDTVHFFGPLTSQVLPEGVDWFLVAGDESALPAIARFLDEFPVDGRAIVIVKVSDPLHVQPLRVLPGVEVIWVTSPTPLDSALLDTIESLAFPDGRPFAWIAGEQSAVRDVRRYLVNERGIPKSDIDFAGYWRYRRVDPASSDALESRSTDEASDRFDELTNLVPALALRAAADVGLGPLLESAPRTVDEIVAATGCDRRAMGKLLRYLRAIDIVSRTDDARFALTEVGESLASDHRAQALKSDSAQSRRDASMAGLLHSLRTGESAPEDAIASPQPDLRSAEVLERQLLDLAEDELRLIAEAIAAAPAIAGTGHLIVHSPIAALLSRLLVARHSALTVTLSARPAQASLWRAGIDDIDDAGQRDRVTVIDQSILSRAKPADVVLLVDTLGDYPDQKAVHTLRATADQLSLGGEVLLWERTFTGDGINEHESEQDLLALTRSGTGLRTKAELESVIDLADFHISATYPIGWGSTLYRLVPPPL